MYVVHHSSNYSTLSTLSGLALADFGRYWCSSNIWRARWNLFTV